MESLARRLFGEPNRRLSTARELRFGRRGSLAVVPSRGVFCDHEAGVGGGLLDMIVHAGAARDRGEAARMLKAGGAIPMRETSRERRNRDVADSKALAVRTACAVALWRSGRTLAGTIGETYLRRARGIGAPPNDAALRFLPDAHFTPYVPDHRRYPAIVAAVVDANAKLTGVHLTFLKPDGSGKAEVSPARKMFGEVGGCHVRLISGKRLVVGEGLESAFSAWEAAVTGQGGSCGEVGAVAALSAGGVAALAWPPETTGLVIAPDNDPSGTGERAAQSLAFRAHAAGLSVAILRPPEGYGDWNDAMREAAR
jgi:hypothetical protein